MMVVMIPSNTSQFQYFWDFNKCLWAIFSQLSFENSGYFWLRFLWLKIIKNHYKLPLKVCELKVWFKWPLDVFQNVKTVQQRKPNLNSIRVIKNASFNQIFCVGLSGLTSANHISFSILWMSPCVISSSKNLCLNNQVFRHKIFLKTSKIY